jgi:hypothetical protein
MPVVSLARRVVAPPLEVGGKPMKAWKEKGTFFLLLRVPMTHGPISKDREQKKFAIIRRGWGQRSIVQDSIIAINHHERRCGIARYGSGSFTIYGGSTVAYSIVVCLR